MIQPIIAMGLPQGGEWFILLIALVFLFGARKLPELARGLGKSVGEFKKAREEFEKELHSAGEAKPEENKQIPGTESQKKS